jgi:competence protein ComEA
VDLNSASDAELEALPGVGPVSARKIVAARPYRSVDDLSRAGLSAKTIEELKPLVKATPGSASVPASTRPKAPPVGVGAPATSSGASQGRNSTTGVGQQPRSTTDRPAFNRRVNLNTATQEELESLPGIGPVKAKLIIDGRPYSTPEDVMKVKGIKEGEFGKIKDLISVR